MIDLSLTFSLSKTKKYHQKNIRRRTSSHQNLSKNYYVDSQNRINVDKK